jgi:hypothetical protein
MPITVGDRARPPTPHFLGVRAMSLATLLLIILVVALIGTLPRWPHSANWGYYPSGGLSVILLVVIVLALMGRI